MSTDLLSIGRGKMDYIEQTSAGIFDDADEAIEEAVEEHGPVSIRTKASDNSKEVESGDTTQKLVDMGLKDESEVKTEKSDIEKRSEDATYTRKQAFKASVGEIEITTPERFKQADATKERLKEIQQVNSEMERVGTMRRYVPSKADVPSSAKTFEDEFGTYYYKGLDVDIRPSDVAEWAEKDHFASLNSEEKVIKTIELMNELEGHALTDGKSEDDFVNWLNRHLVKPNDDPRGKDVFSNEFVRSVANTIARAQGYTEKGRRYVDDPSEAPDDANVQQGPSGGFYYETGGGSNVAGNQGDVTAVEDALEDVGRDRVTEAAEYAGPETVADAVMDEVGDDLTDAQGEVLREGIEIMVQDYRNSPEFEPAQDPSGAPSFLQEDTGNTGNAPAPDAVDQSDYTSEHPEYGTEQVTEDDIRQMLNDVEQYDNVEDAKEFAENAINEGSQRAFEEEIEDADSVEDIAAVIYSLNPDDSTSSSIGGRPEYENYFDYGADGADGGEVTVDDARMGVGDNIAEYIDDPEGRMDPEELGSMTYDEAVDQVMEVAEEAFDGEVPQQYDTQLREHARAAQEMYGGADTASPASEDDFDAGALDEAIRNEPDDYDEVIEGVSGAVGISPGELESMAQGEMSPDDDVQESLENIFAIDLSGESGGATVDEARMAPGDNVAQYIDDPQGRLDMEELGSMSPEEAMEQAREAAEEAFGMPLDEVAGNAETDIMELVRQSQELYGGQ